MKKYFGKITAVILLTTILPMASGFCLMFLLSSVIKVDVAQAVSYDNNTRLITDNSTCSGEQSDEPASDFLMSTSSANHHNSLLPCCLDGSHSGTTAFYQFSELNKQLSATSLAVNPSLIAVFKNTFYNTQIISPPKLSAVKTIILRL
jgi:hypothetical protein